MPKKLEFNEFKERIDKIFNNSINVDDFVYVNSGTKGLCKCNICGNEWYAVPNSLLNGHGCRKCYNKKNSESRKIPYSEIVNILETNGSNVEIIGDYIDTKHKCKIKCKLCGREWEARINEYLKGSGCPVCKYGRLTTDILIKSLKNIYGDKYSYDKVNYVNNRTKIILTCKKHGDFNILPSTALKGYKERCVSCIEEIKKENEILLKKEKNILKNRKEKTCKKENIKEPKKDKTEEFILKCKKVHCNEPYDYSVTEYINSNTKVKVNCLKHGIFYKNPISLLNGQRCPLCARTGHKYTNEEWIKLAKEKYPQFDYSKVNYVNKETKVIIFCNDKDTDGNIHGEFAVYPNAFLRGENKCMKCDKENKRIEKQKDFINKSEILNNKKYDYSKVFYSDIHTKVCIICPEHGEFWQSPLNHVNGSKCPKCAINDVKIMNEIKKREFHGSFIERAKKLHNNKYIYDKVVYNGNENKVIITCPEHGDFEQTPHSHLAGGGCPKCAKNKISEAVRLTQEEYINRVKYVHRYKNYDFSKVIYNTYESEVVVTCSKHGDFKIKAGSLLNGNGCPLCRLSKLETSVRNVLLENDVKHISQKRFKEWLGGQSLDFYIENKTIAIECQGIQHFKNERWYDKLYEIQERDERKKRLCKENGIHLIYYVPDIFSQYMKEDDIYFTNTDDLIDYIKNYKEKTK